MSKIFIVKIEINNMTELQLKEAIISYFTIERNNVSTDIEIMEIN